MSTTATIEPTTITDLEQQKALDHIRELMSTHWREAENAQDEDGKFGIGFKVTFDRGCSPTKLKVTCRISKTLSDEIESVVEDPRQGRLL